jgi:ketosteroid isomerase-like protein
MATKDVLQSYFNCLEAKRGWEDFLAEDMEFISFTSPIKRVSGKRAYLEATKRFYSMIRALEIRGLLVEGEKACALTRYQLQPPVGPDFESYVAEVFEVRNGKIGVLHIYFDSASFPK